MAYIDQNRNRWPVIRLCTVLGVSEAGYYKRLRARERPDADEILLARIYKLLSEDEENANYGVRRIYLGLKLKYDYTGGYRRVLRVYRKNNLMIRRKRHPNGITREDALAQKSENLICQDFTAKAPNEKWLCDITEVPCADGKLYLSAVLDCYDGAIVGFSMAEHMRAELCVEAFTRACRKEGARGMIFHSDRGSQFTSRAFREELNTRGAIQSMSGTGRCYDNARMESFFATLKKEKLYRIDTRHMGRDAVKSIIFRYIHYYNLRRIYSPNGGWPPMVFRNRHAARAA